MTDGDPAFPVHHRQLPKAAGRKRSTVSTAAPRPSGSSAPRVNRWHMAYSEGVPGRRKRSPECSTPLRCRPPPSSEVLTSAVTESSAHPRRSHTQKRDRDPIHLSAARSSLCRPTANSATCCMAFAISFRGRMAFDVSVRRVQRRPNIRGSRISVGRNLVCRTNNLPRF
jgi:hypothetical protein